ncbi:MAG: ATP-binding cassette domain-containing protein [Candidatus Omnitrophota bacterium]
MKTKKRHKKLGQILLEKELITEFQLKGALAEHKKTGIPLGRILVDEGIIDQEIVEQIVSRQENIVQRFLRIRKFAHRAGLKLKFLFFTLILSLITAALGALSVGLLIPLLRGIINQDFSFIRTFPYLGKITNFLPAAFFQNNTNIFIFLVALIALAAVGQQVLSYLSKLIITAHLQTFSSGLRKIIFNRYMSFGKLYFDQNNFGYLNNVLMGFTSQLSNLLRSLNTLITGGFRTFFYLVIMFFVSWRLTLIVLLIFPIFHFSLKTLIRKIKQQSRELARFTNNLSRKIYNILSCISLTKLYVSEKRETDKFSQLSDTLKEKQIQLAKKSMFMGPFHQLGMIFLMLGLISWVAFVVVKEKTADLSGFLVFFYLLKSNSSSFSLFNNFRSSLAQVQGPISEIKKVLSSKDKFFVRGGKKKFKGFAKEIRYKNLNFSYLDEREILKDINFSVPYGKMVAFVGPTGAGKTTLANLLLRFYDCPSNSIFIDGQDIKKFNIKSLRKKMGLVSQQTLLFNDTLRHNIAYGQKEVSDNQIMEVVKKARLTKFIKQLPKGLDTLIGDRGARLSGGEQQRVAIARAMLKEADILILDEATSALDTKTERLIQEAIEEAVKGRTTIVIAHRLSTIKNADKVVVIEDGKIIERGFYGQLVKQKGRFYQYLQEQKFF